MTEQPVETEQQFLGNELRVNPHTPSAIAVLDCTGGKLCEATQHLEGCYAPDFQARAAAMAGPRQHYIPNAHRYRFSVPAAEVEAQEKGPTNLELEAEVHAGHAVRSLENGELDAGIAWLQSALAFAQNARHALEISPAGGAV